MSQLSSLAELLAAPRPRLLWWYTIIPARWVFERRLDARARPPIWLLCVTLRRHTAYC